MLRFSYCIVLVLLLGCHNVGDQSFSSNNTDSSIDSKPESVDEENVLQRLEGKKDSVLLKAFLDWQQTQPDLIAHGESQHLSFYFAFDLNADGIKEVAYQDYYRGEERQHIRIFQKNSIGYTKVFEDFQNITEINLDSPIEQLVISDHGCCDNPCMLLKYYSIYDSAGHVFFQLQREVGYLRGIERDFTNYEHERKLVLLGDSIRMIANPKFQEFHHHLVAVLKKQSRGIAMGESTFSEKQWVFVKIPANDIITSQCFDPTPGLELQGWIPKEYLNF